MTNLYLILSFKFNIVIKFKRSLQIHIDTRGTFFEGIGGPTARKYSFDLTASQAWSELTKEEKSELN